MQIIRASEDVNKAIDAMVGFVDFLGIGDDPWLLIGIADGGIPLSQELARRVQKKLGLTLPLGSLNVSFHRDDIGSRPIPLPKTPTSLPQIVDRANVILIDDVIHSGRTIRAALDELFEHGRPRMTKLITMVDRGHRVLPIQPDYAAFALDLETNQSLKVVIDPKDDQGNRIWVMEKEKKL
jgi:pyrimidine operon attenuation protein / uracil phosphoribosyltransferase